MSAKKRPAGDITPSNYDSPSKIKRLEPVFKTPLTYSPRVLSGKPVPSPLVTDSCKLELDFNESEMIEDESDEEISFKITSSAKKQQQDNASYSEEKSPAALRNALKERNTERGDFLLKIKGLSEKNKQYKTKLQRDDLSSKHRKILQKSYETQTGEENTLLKNLQEIIAEHEAKILSLEQQIHGNITAREDSNTSAPTSTSKLIEQIRQLQHGKSQVLNDLNSLHQQIEKDHLDTIKSLQNNNFKIETEKSQLEEDIVRLKTDPSCDLTNPATDTEKHLCKMTEDNVRLKQEVHRYKVRQSSIGFCSENEQIRNLQEDNDRLEEMLSKSEKKLAKTESTLKETESNYRDEVCKLSKENQKISRLLRDTKADVTCLQAREPEIMTKIERVEVEVESDDLRQVLTESQKDNALLETDVNDWRQKYTELTNQMNALQEQNINYNKQLQQNIEEVIEMEEKHEKQIERMKGEMNNKVEKVKNEIQEELESLRSTNSSLRSKILSVNTTFEELCESHEALKKQASHFPRIISVTIDCVKTEAVRAIEDINQKNHELVGKYHKEMKLRKKYHNELVELRGNIRVFCRVRPCIKEDGFTNSSQIIVTYDPYDDGLLFIANKTRSQVFELDKVFDEKVSQVEVFEEVRSLVTSCVDGYNVCIFAYGQTGSGKTYTMEGPQNDPGINQRALQELFSETQERGMDTEYSITVSVLEIYNENIRDLLNDEGLKLEIKMKADGRGLHVPGLKTVEVTSLNHVNQVFLTGQKNRATATTNLNEHSSRSHLILNIEVTGYNKTTNTRTSGKLNLVDLAGSERVSRSGADGARLKEAQNINKSLSCLGDVIHSLRSKQNHIPYRNSKLTYLLQDSLGGDSKTLMIVQVSPVDKNVSESVCTLNFAQRVRLVELGTAGRQVESGDINENTVSTPTRNLKTDSPKSPMINSPKYTTPGKTTNNKTPLSARRALTPRYKPK